MALIFLWQTDPEDGALRTAATCSNLLTVALAVRISRLAAEDCPVAMSHTVVLCWENSHNKECLAVGGPAHLLQENLVFRLWFLTCNVPACFKGGVTFFFFPIVFSNRHLMWRRLLGNTPVSIQRKVELIRGLSSQVLIGSTCERAHRMDTPPTPSTTRT